MAWGTFNISGATYDSKSKDMSATGTYIFSMAFKSDGTKVYICGLSTKVIYQYSLSTAWDISTASYDSKSYNPTGTIGSNTARMNFNTDGTKMLILGGVKLYRFSLSTPWDVSTASFDTGKSVTITGDNSLEDFYLKSDGTKLYFVGNQNNKIYQWGMSTAFDPTTASSDSKEISVASQDGDPTDVFFKDNGTKMYVVGNANNSVFQYSLSTAWDVSTATYDSDYFSVNSQSTTPEAINFKEDDGTKMFIGEANGIIYQYTAYTPVTTTSNFFQLF